MTEFSHSRAAFVVSYRQRPHHIVDNPQTFGRGAAAENCIFFIFAVLPKTESRRDMIKASLKTYPQAAHLSTEL